MRMEAFVFFTMNDFTKEGGGTIRMLGIINELSHHDVEIYLVSNIIDKSKVSPSVKHIDIGYLFSRKDKRGFQFILGAFNYRCVNLKYKKLLEKLSLIYALFNERHKFIFFEYVDNSIGYWLKKNYIIDSYINDIHGIAGFEFDFQFRKANTIKDKIRFKLKKNVSKSLDKKVFNNANGIIYASGAMLEYFSSLYPTLSGKENIHLPYLLNLSNLGKVNHDIVSQFKKKLQLKDNDFVFLFAGAFKETGGVQNLILAFEKVHVRHGNIRLLLVGDGYSLKECQSIVSDKKLEGKVHFFGRQPYGHLASFQSLSDVIITPDRQNDYSELIVHVKYLDALISGKLVINGAFKSVKEMNEEKELSLLFTPSDVDSLALTMEKAINEFECLKEQFSDVASYVMSNFAYSKKITNLLAQ